MIGADIVIPKMRNFCGSKTRPLSAACKFLTLLLLAFRKLSQKAVPEAKPEVVRFAGQSSALQLLTCQLLD